MVIHCTSLPRFLSCESHSLSVPFLLSYSTSASTDLKKPSLRQRNYDIKWNSPDHHLSIAYAIPLSNPIG